MHVLCKEAARGVFGVCMGCAWGVHGVCQGKASWLGSGTQHDVEMHSSFDAQNHLGLGIILMRMLRQGHWLSCPTQHLEHRRRCWKLFPLAQMHGGMLAEASTNAHTHTHAHMRPHIGTHTFLISPLRLVQLRWAYHAPSPGLPRLPMSREQQGIQHCVQHAHVTISLAAAIGAQQQL